MPLMGPSGGGRALLSLGDWSTTRWTSPWTLGRWDYHTLLCYEQLFTCWYLHVERWLLCGEGEMQHLDVTEGKCFVSWLLLCSPKMSSSSLVLLREFGVSFTKKHSCTIIFSVGASSPQPAVIMWIMCFSWMPARNQIHAPLLAGKHASIMTRVSGRGLAQSP